MRAGEVTSEIGHIDLALRAGLQILDLDVAGLELVTADDGEMGAGLGGPVELLAQATRGQVRPAGESGAAQLGRKLEPDHSVRGVGSDHHDSWAPGLRDRASALLGESQGHAIESDTEADSESDTESESESGAESGAEAGAEADRL